MTTIAQTISSLFIDHEGAEIPTQTEVIEGTHHEISRSTQPISELKAGKFRRLFDRHSIIR